MSIARLSDSSRFLASRPPHSRSIVAAHLRRVVRWLMRAAPPRSRRRSLSQPPTWRAAGGTPEAMPNRECVIEVRNLQKHYPVGSGLLRSGGRVVRAVDG